MQYAIMLVMGIIDIVIIALLIGFALIGLWKGFIKGVSSLLCFSLASLGSYLLRKPFAALLDKWFSISGKIASKISEKLTETSTVFTDYTSNDIVELKTLVNESSLSETLKKVFNSLLGNVDYPEPVSIGEIISSKIATLATVLIATAIAFVLLRIIIFILTLIIKKAIKNKTLGRFDKILGAVFYIAKGGLIILVMFALLSLLYMIPDVSAKIDSFLGNSVIAKAGFERVNEFILQKLGKG